MKKLTSLLTALVFASLVIFISCGDDDGGGPEPTAGQVAAGLLAAGDWSAPSTVTNGNDETVTGDWSGFDVNFTVTGTDLASGSYSSSGLPAPEFADVWPASGTWSINEAGTVITRNDGVTIDVSNLTATTVTLDLNDITESARVSGIDGDWTFVF